MKVSYYNISDLPKTVVIKNGSGETIYFKAEKNYTLEDMIFVDIENLFSEAISGSRINVLLSKSNIAYYRDSNCRIFIDGWISLNEYINGGSWINDPERINDIKQRNTEE